MGKHVKEVDCADHRPVQHRDGKLPWCRACGLTKTGETPTRPS